jgi:hypothetical protein
MVVDEGSRKKDKEKTEKEKQVTSSREACQHWKNNCKQKKPNTTSRFVQQKLQPTSVVVGCPVSIFGARNDAEVQG